MKRVIIFQPGFLALSQTFIKSQMLALQRWQAALVGYHYKKAGLPLAGLETQLVLGKPISGWQRLLLKITQLFNIAHPPTVAFLAQQKANFVHVHFATKAVDVWPSVRKAGLPMLVTLHGTDINICREWWESGQRGLRRRFYPKRLLQLSRHPGVHFVAVSQSLRMRAVELGIAPEKIIVHYIGVDTHAFQPGPVPIQDRDKRILFVGRLIENKGVEYLIRAYARTLAQTPEAQLIIAGDGPLRRTLKQLAGTLGINVTFLGSVGAARVRDELNKARMLCLPSVTIDNGNSEGFGMVLLEAQACGVPVISSAKSGAHEGMIDHETGFRFDERDVDALSHHLQQLLTDDALAMRFSRNAVQFCGDRFNLDKLTHSLELTYDRLYGST